MDTKKWRAPAVVAAVVLGFGAIAFLRVQSLNKPRSHTEETQHSGPGAGQTESLNVAFLTSISSILASGSRSKAVTVLVGPLSSMTSSTLFSRLSSTPLVSR